jgi:uridylate kinase
MSYKRVLLKISGEQLSGEYESGIDPKHVDWLASEVEQTLKSGCQIVIMVGGGNFVRGATVAGQGIKRVTADHMGMLGTMINALAITDIFEERGLPTRCLSNIFAGQVAEPFVHRLANKHLEKGRIVIVAGGIGRPYLTTDTAAVALSLELDCQAVLKATKVDGVYSADPKVDPAANKLDNLTHQQAVENPAIKVMDRAALGLATDYKLPIIVFDLKQPGAIAKVVAGDKIGTQITSV